MRRSRRRTLAPRVTGQLGRRHVERVRDRAEEVGARRRRARRTRSPAAPRWPVRENMPPLRSCGARPRARASTPAARAPTRSRRRQDRRAPEPAAPSSSASTRRRAPTHGLSDADAERPHRLGRKRRAEPSACAARAPSRRSLARRPPRPRSAPRRPCPSAASSTAPGGRAGRRRAPAPAQSMTRPPLTSTISPVR